MGSERPIGLGTVNRVLGQVYGKALREQRDALVKRPMVMESFMPGITASHIAELDELIALADRAAAGGEGNGESAATPA